MKVLFLSQRQGQNSKLSFCPSENYRDKSRDKTMNYSFDLKSVPRDKNKGQNHKKTVLTVGTKVGTKLYININICLSLSRGSWGSKAA